MQSAEIATCFSEETLSELRKPLDKRLVSERKAGHGKVKYLEGHVAIDQADRIFGYGNWGYEPLSVEQVVLYDPLSGEAVGIEYKALVKLVVRGCEPITDIGSQPVATWNVEDHIMAKRTSDAERRHGIVDEDAPFTWLEKKQARSAIMEAHEAAKKGAVTDAMKRCLRVYGAQFGNELYGDGTKTRLRPATAEQLQRIRAYAQTLGYEDPGELIYEDADQLLREWFAEYNAKKSADDRAVRAG